MPKAKKVPILKKTIDHSRSYYSMASPVAPNGWEEAVGLLCEVEHLVASCDHPAAGGQPRVAAHKPQPAGEQAVQQGIFRQVERHLALQRHLSPVGTWTHTSSVLLLLFSESKHNTWRDRHSGLILSVFREYSKTYACYLKGGIFHTVRGGHRSLKNGQLADIGM